MQENLTLWGYRRGHLGREGMPAKIPAVGAGAAAGASRGKRGGSGREEGDGREEGAAAPLEALWALLPVVRDDRVASVLWRLIAWLSKYVSKQGRLQIESVSSAHTIEKGWLWLGKMLFARMPWWRHWTVPVVHAPFVWSANLLVDERGILMRGSSGLHCSQPVLVCCPWATVEGMPLRRTPCLLSKSHRAKRADVWKNAKAIPTGSIPMAQKARPHRATALPCVLGYRAAALRGKVPEVVSDETIQRELNKRLIHECRCDERLKAKLEVLHALALCCLPFLKKNQRGCT
jgi:hypothetical protein